MKTRSALRRWRMPYGVLLAFSLWSSAVVAQTAAIKVVYSFQVADGVWPNGSQPLAGLTLGQDGNFYGTTSYGMNPYAGSGGGTVFRVTTNGALTTLLSFDTTANPSALTLGHDGAFYGTTASGGAAGSGTVFKVAPDGTLNLLASFGGTNGVSPLAGLTLGRDGVFYGTTSGGGNNGNHGTVFKVTTAGELTTLACFSFTNGHEPLAGLTEGADGSLYGTTHNGGSSGPSSPNYGTVFRLTTNGVLTTLANFNGSNGSGPNALTLGPDGNFYGTTAGGGAGGYGTVFTLVFPLQFFTDAGGPAVANGMFRTCLIGPPNAIVVIEGSSDLTNWTAVSTNTLPAADAGGLPVSLPMSDNRRQFYRAR